MNIRKSNKVSAHTVNNVAIIGTVTSVHGEFITIETPAGETHDVLKATSNKLSAAEFKTQVLEATQPKVEVKAAKKTAKPAKKAVAKTETKVNKKADARAIFVKLAGKKGKEVITAFVDTVGLSAAGASTYYQNFKSGTWATVEATK